MIGVSYPCAGTTVFTWLMTMGNPVSCVSLLASRYLFLHPVLPFLPYQPIICLPRCSSIISSLLNTSGVVLAVRGMAEPGGDFIVTDVCYPDMAPQPPLPPSACLKAAGTVADMAAAAGVSGRTDDKYVALVSGLALGSGKADGLQVRVMGQGADGMCKIDNRDMLGSSKAN